MEFDKLLSQSRRNAAQIQKIATKLKITVPEKFPGQVVQLNDCLDTYSAAKVMIATVVQDVTNFDGLEGWVNMTSHFDKNWDAFAKEYNEIFNKANPDQQANILEPFARNHFGDSIFEAGGVIKNETPQILSGISEFKNAVGLFSGSYRNPVEAANKIKNGVNAIVRSTEKVAKSTDNILKFIQKKRGFENEVGTSPLAALGILSQNRIIGGAMSTLNIGASGINAFSSGGSMIDAIKNGDLNIAQSAAKATYNNVKSIVEEIKNLTHKKPAGAGGTPYSPSQTSQSQSSTANGSSSTATESSGPSYSYVCSKAKIKCSNGDKISTLTVLPSRTIWLYGQPQANISDHISMVNIAPCGKCHTTAYPPTGSATAANHGRLTPMPCIPNTPFPWMNGKNDVLLKGNPALISTSKLKCIYGGTITITFDGQEV